MNTSSYNSFIFSPSYRVLRHIVFWVLYTFVTATILTSYSQGQWNLGRTLFQGLLWLPARILYCYPLMYWAMPQYLLKGRYARFGIIIFLWAIAGTFLNYLYRVNFFIPVQEALHYKNIVRDPWSPGSYALITTAAGLTCIIVLFKHWYIKQQEWMQAEKGKVTAELQLLKAQVHPHFLFNTLNNIYSFSLENSPKTPGLILKLSSLLSYMLYDCKAEEVRLEKEIEIMKNYIDLEKERYGNKIEISWEIEGEVKDKNIAPLLLLPFLENAFKHGTSEQLEKPWLSVDISVKGNTVKCKIVNSKNEFVPVSQNGIGIENVKKRLAFIYPGKHELKISEENNFFVVSLLIVLKNYRKQQTGLSPVNNLPVEKIES
ncbi:MAG: histidine kinase [Chitinophagaceae bacterium]